MSARIFDAVPLAPGTTSVKTSSKLSLKKLNITQRKKLIIGIGAAALLALAAFYFWGGSSSAPVYMTAKVERGNLRNTVTATGTLQAVTTVQVGSQASGTISALHADFNSVVKKGQVVAELDPSLAKAQVDQSRAALQQAQASLQLARAGVANSRAGVNDSQARALAAQSAVQNSRAGVSSSQANLAVLKAQQDDALSLLKQQESLLKSGVIAQRDYDTAKTSYQAAEARYNQAQAQVNMAVYSEQSAAGAGIAQSAAQVQQSQAQVQQAQAQVQQAQAQVLQAQAALRLAEVNLTHLTIVSPIDGIVVSRNVDVGQTVAASLSAPTLFTIANDLKQMQVIANIDQADIGLVEQAKAVKFTVDAFPGKDFDGKIQQMRLNPTNVQNVVTYNVVMDVNNPEQKLKPGMTANLVITIDERNSVLKVANSALRFTPQDASGQKISAGPGGANSGAGDKSGQARRANANANGSQPTETTNAPATSSSPAANSSGRTFAPPSAPVLEGQTRVIWVLGTDGKPQSRRIKIGLTDGAATEVIEGNLQEGEMVITGQTLSAASKAKGTQSPAPGFGGAPSGGGRRN
ncbi:MAG TPA: efflux RND transporter periplasmic adaptor subunit [Pyrinomonadaceae bacterium]|nr:efflux RND transporter periplasmic adaptor subunit [Pyrinomonadaceae bacterium]